MKLAEKASMFWVDKSR